MRRRALLRLEQAREAFGGVEVEVFFAYHPLQAQEVLHPGDLHHGIGDQTFAGHEQELRQREVLQPPLQMPHVNPDLQRHPGDVDDPRAVQKGKILEPRHLDALALHLRVIGYRSGYGISHHDDQFHSRVHVLYPLRYLARHEV